MLEEKNGPASSEPMTPIHTQSAERDVRTLLSGYAVSYEFKTPRFYFRLFGLSPAARCRWIWPSLPSGDIPTEAITFLMDAVKTRKPVTLDLTAPIGRHLGENVCRVVNLSTLPPESLASSTWTQSGK